MKNTRGYTLIEVLVAVSLFSMALLGVYGVLSTGNIVFNKDTAMGDMESQCRNALDRMVREVRQASSQTITTNYNSTTNDKISFVAPAFPLGVQYYLNGSSLVRVGSDGVEKKIASDVAVLKFSLTGSLLTMQIKASKTFYNQAVSFPLVQKVRLRNE